MLKLVSQRKIKENWKTYKEQVRDAMVSTDGALAFVEGKTEETLKGIYSRLMNPFSHQMHLWIDDDDEYLFNLSMYGVHHPNMLKIFISSILL